MRRCYELARLGNSYVAPNPMVGAVLVHEGRIIGEGWHQRFGEAHAEVNCLDAVKPEDLHLLPSSTLYVSLEPCAHQGKTPPCADRIIEAGIPSVVIGVTDPHLPARISGVQKLRAAGIHVTLNVLPDEGRELLKQFLCYHEKHRPYITLKWAESADGYIGRSGERIHISHALSDRMVHQLRADHQAILIGQETLLNDDPALTVRLVPGKDPVRIILGRSGNVPPESRITQHTSGYTLVVNEERACYVEHMECIKVPDTRDIRGVLQALYELKILSVLVEGGARILQSFIDSGLWDEAYIFCSTTELGSGVAAPHIDGRILEQTQLETDTLTRILHHT